MIFSNSNIVEEGIGGKALAHYNGTIYTNIRAFTDLISISYLYKNKKIDNDFMKTNKSTLLNKVKSDKSFTYKGYIINEKQFTAGIQNSLFAIKGLCPIDVINMLTKGSSIKAVGAPVVFMNPDEFKTKVYQHLWADKSITTWNDFENKFMDRLYPNGKQKKDLSINELNIPERIKFIETDADANIAKWYEYSNKQLRIIHNIYKGAFDVGKEGNTNKTSKNIESNLVFLANLNKKLYELAVSSYKTIYADYMSSCKQLLAYKPSKENYSILDEAMTMV